MRSARAARVPSAFIDGSLLFIEPVDGVVEVEPLGEVVPIEPLVPGEVVVLGDVVLGDVVVLGEVVELGVSLVDGLVDDGGVVTVEGVVVVDVALGALAGSVGPEVPVLWAQVRPPAMAKAIAAAADKGFRFPLMSVLLCVEGRSPVGSLQGAPSGGARKSGKGDAQPAARRRPAPGLPVGQRLANGRKPEMDQDDQRSFGVFKPVGHVVVSFPSADQSSQARQALLAAGFDTGHVRPISATDMVAQAERDLERGSSLAAIGQEMNLVRAHLALAQRGYHFLVVKTPRDAQAVQVADLVAAHGAERAQLYGNFIVEELIDHPEDLSPVAESPDRGLDAQTPSGEESERGELRPPPGGTTRAPGSR